MFLSRLAKGIRRFIRRKDGASGIEYAIVAAMVAVVLAGFMGDISESVRKTFDEISTSLTTESNKIE